MTNCRRVTQLGLAIFLAMVASPRAHGQSAHSTENEKTPARSCASLTALQIPGFDMKITKAEAIPTAPAGTIRISAFAPDTIRVAVPSYCRADGVMDQRIGVGGKPYAIGFAIALPDNWNGRFLFQGGGGLNGTVNPPLGIEAAGSVPGLARGFAVVSTDTGHKGAVFDPSFMNDQEAALNFAYLAVGKVTSVAKQIIAQYYREPARHSYFVGCSTGGREAMLMSERYPDDFDGIVSGDPAMETGYSNIGLGWATVAFNQIAPRDANGKSVPTKDFSSGDRKLIVNAILEACDDKDGLKDGMIFNRRACQFDPAVLQCKREKTEACLSADQVDALHKAFGGPKDSRGNQVYPGFPYDPDMVAEATGLSFLPSPGPNILVNVLPSLKLDVDQQVGTVRANATQTLTDTASWTNLSTFSGHGGKLLFYHGTSDPWFSFMDTVGYYERLGRDNGGPGKVLGWSRLYLVPGMSHCQGGPATLDQFDLLTALVNWVENGTAPDFVIATGQDFPGRSRPLCSYPKYAHYKGRGDPQDAANFECRE
jgi:pimeloyl-ACP methyl ester carboxylesterase